MGDSAQGLPPPFFPPPPIPLYTHTYPFSFWDRTGQGKEGGAAQKCVGQSEVLLFHVCNWSKRDTQCTVDNLTFTNMNWNKGNISRKKKINNLLLSLVQVLISGLSLTFTDHLAAHALQSGGQTRTDIESFCLKHIWNLLIGTNI